MCELSSIIFQKWFKTTAGRIAMAHEPDVFYQRALNSPLDAHGQHCQLVKSWVPQISVTTSLSPPPFSHVVLSAA